VPGNGESLEELAKACRGWDSVHVLHGTGATIAGVPFFGLGGGVPVTPFGAWSYDFTEQQAAALLADCPEACVLVSHSPPKHVVDVDASGNSLGSTAVRATIEAKKPLVCVCGHIHACWRQIGEIGATQVVNAGPIGIEWTVNV
jgi:Icc-related predicted phosphoesterase